jgi:ferredoxin-NADP reductase/ferredoxin
LSSGNPSRSHEVLDAVGTRTIARTKVGDDRERAASVKREHDGAASGYLHAVLHTGDQLEVAAPRGTFILDTSAAPLLLITAGVGATPALAMVHALAEEHSAREIWWLHGARNSRDHPFATESRALLASLPDVRIRVCYSRPGPDDLQGRDFDGAGRLSGALLAELGLPRDAEAYLCGPAPFMEQISAALAAIGLGASRIHTEPFGPAPGLTPGIAPAPARAPHPPPGEPGTGPTIEFARADLAVRWNDDYPSLLELAEACDVPVRWSCRTGVCHNCETTLIAGTLDYDPEPVEPPADGSALICCARPRGPRPVVDPLDPRRGQRPKARASANAADRVRVQSHQRHGRDLRQESSCSRTSGATRSRCSLSSLPSAERALPL